MENMVLLPVELCPCDNAELLPRRKQRAVFCLASQCQMQGLVGLGE